MVPSSSASAVPIRPPPHRHARAPSAIRVSGPPAIAWLRPWPHRQVARPPDQAAFRAPISRRDTYMPRGAFGCPRHRLRAVAPIFSSTALADARRLSSALMEAGA